MTRRPLLLALLLLLGTAGSAAAQSETGFSLRPANPDADLPATQAYYILQLPAGGSKSDELLVLNSGSSELTLDVYAVDAVTGATTGAVYTNRGSSPNGAGAWLKLPQGQLRVPANSTARVPFEVRAPEGARPGQYLGGIAAQASGSAPSAPIEPSAGGRQGQFTLTTVTRSVVAVAVTVPGAMERKLSATEVRMLSGAGGARLAVGIRNDGNVMLKPRGQLVLRDRTGAERGRLPLEMDTILPGGSAELTVPWPKELPAGQYRADLALESSDALPGPTSKEDEPAALPARVETTDQPLTVERESLQEVSRSGVVALPGTTRLAPAPGGLPWWLPFAAMLVVGNVALGLFLLRRRR